MVLDLVIGVGILVSALLSFLRGFIREVLTIVGVVGGAAAAYWFSPALFPITRGWFNAADEKTPKIMGLLPPGFVADSVAYLIIFLSVMVVLSVLSHVLSASVRSIGLGALDRSLGVVFGVVRGAVVFALLYLPIHFWTSDKTKTEWFGDSYSFVYLQAMAGFMAGLLPEGSDAFVAKSKETVEQIDDTRRKLEAIDLLEGGPAASPATGEKGKGAPEPGYDDATTRAMDSFIKLQQIQKDVFEKTKEPPLNP